jgi:transposase InsO family protein
MASFFAGMKTEQVHDQQYPNREAAKRDLFADIEGYDNRQRIHSALGSITPEQAELRTA